MSERESVYLHANTTKLELPLALPYNPLSIQDILSHTEKNLPLKTLLIKGKMINKSKTHCTHTLTEQPDSPTLNSNHSSIMSKACAAGFVLFKE